MDELEVFVTVVEAQGFSAAAKRLEGHARRTPILTSPFLDEVAGRRGFVKAECLQHTGSFKYRGAWSAISALAPEERERGVIAYSSGNHAQGVALAARRRGIRAESSSHRRLQGGKDDREVAADLGA